MDAWTISKWLYLNQNYNANGLWFINNCCIEKWNVPYCLNLKYILFFMTWLNIIMGGYAHVHKIEILSFGWTSRTFFLLLEFPTAEILGSFILILHNFVYWKKKCWKTMSANALGHFKWAAVKILNWNFVLVEGGINALYTVIVMFCFHVFCWYPKCIFYESVKTPYCCNVWAWFGYSLRLMVRYQRLEELRFLGAQT